MYFLLRLSAFVVLTNCKCLVREPSSSLAPPQSGDMGFYVAINERPQFYEERNLYTISIRGDKTQFVTKQFTEFLLVVENVPRPQQQPATEGESSNQPGPPLQSPPALVAPANSPLLTSSGRTGSFQLLGDVLTRFSDHCANSVAHTSSVAKSDIEVLWRAPPAGSGCVVFKATVVENPETWAMDTGRLSMTLCEAKVEEHSRPDDVVEPCCACEEAKYEVSFEGLWSEETHPRNFPTSKWLLHFSDIIGASHSADFRVWEYGGYASKGLEQVAKYGSPRVLESELKDESHHIRTIIKARGLWYPNVKGKTFAVFRTDKRNHLVSLVSMIGPSPDWIVGVSGLELCLPNCSWVESKELFLYPWDVGVDDGISYESPDSPSDPHMPITRLTSRHPDDPRQPFWNETGAPMKPMAKLEVNRQRLYTKSCREGHIPFENDVYDESVFGPERGMEDEYEEDVDPGCETGPWTSWSSCSATCGKGVAMRQRNYSLPDKAAMLGCDRQLVQKEMCSSKVPLCQGGSGFYGAAPKGFLPDDMCATTEWSRWSDCSTSCGKGFLSRTRTFYNRMGRKKCPHVETMEKEMCAGQMPVCPEHQTGDLNLDPHCAVTSWSEWSPCSVSCGKGLKVRTRLYKVSPQQQTSLDCNVQLMEKASCSGPRPECKFDSEDAKYICGLEKEMGPCRGYFPRWHYNSKTKMCLQFIYGGCRGNSNNFERYEDCMKLCEMKDILGTHSGTKETSIGGGGGEEEEAGRYTFGHHTRFHDRTGESSSSLYDPPMKKPPWMDHSEKSSEVYLRETDDNDGEDHGKSSDDLRHTIVEGTALANTASPDFQNDFAIETRVPVNMTDMDLIKKRMMLLQEQAHLRNGGLLSPVSRPNVFETREQRRRRLIEEERTKQMAEMKERMLYNGPSTIHPPVDCLVTSWSPWSDCSATCDHGPHSGSFAAREKFRMIKRHEAAGGKKCPKKLRKRQRCRLPKCRQDCLLGEWGGWSECSQSCGSAGVQVRSRNDESKGIMGRQSCGPNIEKRVCILADCPERQT